MTYAEVLPYIQTAVVYTIGYFFGRHRGKRNAEAEVARMRKLAEDALALAKQSPSTVKLTSGMANALRNHPLRAES